MRTRPTGNRDGAAPGHVARRVKDSCDVHIQVGLADYHIRLLKKHYQCLLDTWILGREDIVVYRMEDIPKIGVRETLLVLRGEAGGTVTSEPSIDWPNRDSPDRYLVLTAEELRAHGLDQRASAPDPGMSG